MLQPSLYTAASPPVKDEPKLEREPEKALESEQQQQQQLTQRRLSPPQHQVLQGTPDAQRHELKQEELDQAALLHHCQAHASLVGRPTPAVSAADTGSSRVSSPAEDRKDLKGAVSTVSVVSTTSTYPSGVSAAADHSNIPERKADCRVSPHSESQAASAGEEQAGIVKVEPIRRSSTASNPPISLTNRTAGVASSVSPEPMSNGPPPPVGHPRQHVSYPEQHQPTYSQAPMPSGPYGYSPITTQPPMDPYRAGQQPLPPNHAMALPSMRSLAPLQHQQQQQQQHHQHPQHAMSMTHAPIPTAYYAQHMMNPYGMGPDLRFALPLTDPRIQMSGGRNKKEIKRRTKTGCLTCRKRRIKCDETHPTCNNCKKSKRECAGYDPLFTNVTTPPGPSTIQPASLPPQATTGTGPVPGSAPGSITGTAPSTGSPSLSPYSNHLPAPVVPSNYAPAPTPPQGHHYDPNPSSASSASAPVALSSSNSIDYSGGIDPALDTGTASSAIHHHQHHQHHHQHSHNNHHHQHSSNTNPNNMSHPGHYRAGSPAFYNSCPPLRLP
ncbi:hypothetical protein MGG_05153 [Pyricularia oryzae 70-15]|uniref:Zn(2)-C6 fungal-type domain-containing protein n=1 Tax=Pyricularia oryzae (strain 70-15 / ATCC MYA-4617 / FGSC 8958) TaxID=242507 RepID=G4N4R4_PYRO7|nr:uncharacterized protein MGG_05153 [Pyricularia oryzae 70-15]EHA52879.1 hypothetical protein MGG_05153 [Pyricularia oryzae 70-15]